MSMFTSMRALTLRLSRKLRITLAALLLVIVATTAVVVAKPKPAYAMCVYTSHGFVLRSTDISHGYYLGIWNAQYGCRYWIVVNWLAWYRCYTGSYWPDCYVGG